MQGFIWTALGSSAVTLALIGIAGYLGRSQLSHWLNKDLESIKAQHQRDLEAYKTSLIAQAEAVKAAQDVRKLLAVKVAEKRFALLDKIHTITSQYFEFAGASVGASGRRPKEVFEESIERLKEFDYDLITALMAARVFFEVSEWEIVHDHAEVCRRAFELAVGANNQPIPDNAIEKCRVDLNESYERAHEVLHRQINRMLAMTED